MDKLMLWGACAVMAVVGSFSLWKISQIPKIDPAIVKLKNEFERMVKGPVTDFPPRVPAIHIAYLDAIPEPRPATPEGDRFRTKMEGKGHPRKSEPVYILPVAPIDSAKADLDGLMLTWTLENPEVWLEPWMVWNKAKPTGLIIHRQCGDGPLQAVAKLGPEARSFIDLSAEPRQTYRYWVAVTGLETDLRSNPLAMVARMKGLNASAETTTPSVERVKLVGGDKDNAVLRVEMYDRAQKKWIAGKTLLTAPGRGIGASGWTLKRLRFDNFTLVADVTDDGGVDRVLTTKD
jgi:hypothetical protein